MFLVLGLPRSRTFWLSKFLSYGDFECGHEEARHLRTMDDAKIWLTQEHRGSAETSLAPFWRLARDINPKLRVVVVRRAVGEVVASLMALNMRGVCEFNEKQLSQNMAKYDAKLQQITHRVPGVLSVQFDELSNEETAKKIFEFCLPYPFDVKWWDFIEHQNLQCNMRSLMRYAAAYRKPLDALAKTAAHLSRAKLTAQPPLSRDGVTFQQESFDDWIRDGTPLFQEHLIAVGEPPDNWKNKNLPVMRKLYEIGAMQITTARSNGKMFGYLAAIVNPSLEFRDVLSGVHTTFYVSKDMPGIGLKLQRASVAALREKGVGQVFFHEGVRGEGPRMGAMYRRLGAEELGRFFKMEFPQWAS